MAFVPFPKEDEKCSDFYVGLCVILCLFERDSIEFDLSMKTMPSIDQGVSLQEGLLFMPLLREKGFVRDCGPISPEKDRPIKLLSCEAKGKRVLCIDCSVTRICSSSSAAPVQRWGIICSNWLSSIRGAEDSKALFSDFCSR